MNSESDADGKGNVKKSADWGEGGTKQSAPFASSAARETRKAERGGGSRRLWRDGVREKKKTGGCHRKGANQTS